MLTKISGMVADVAIGLLLAGVLMGVLVPAVGATVGPATALGVAVVSAVGAMAVGHALRRSSKSGGD